jgi:hypothetical protein
MLCNLNVSKAQTYLHARIPGGGGEVPVSIAGH